eukprot:CAMPEP_0201629718 /NCGR_PEP_ID=MMETSP0493-20130528/4284_1 /ASSEMBLY_ACC=CAM_ASM_000838 /TAXON_ID=420259 /ORGANISM="Thalassiosira gravida, Strain GMp14c1" /LENGTH=883 /DNA_ID=CAMNT_0048100759 /DNA_START=1487 /DNA_END=4138 /DNA_ORIENTATION=+
MSSSSPNNNNNNNSNNNNASSSLPPNYRKTNISQPGPNDILCGRGGGTNAHSGNIKFRKLVAAHKLRYLAASKSDKPGVARDVVREWRAMDPPGRFLAKSAGGAGDPPSSAAGAGVAGVVVVGENGNAVWHDVGDKKAREKASQCLRERNGAANEAVAALVKTVTASGEACPEDYATLMNKAAYVKAKNDLTIREQNERMRLNTMRNGGGGASGGANGGANGNVNGSGMGSASRIDARGRGGGGNNLYQEAFEPISLNQQRFSPGSGFDGNNNNSINNNNSGHNNNNANNMEDDMIEAEIQRLLMQRQQQLMARRNNASNNMGNNGGGGGGAPQAYMGEESVMREYEQLMRKQRELNIIAGKLGLGGNGNGNIGGGGGGNAMGNSMGMMNTFNTNGMNSHMMSQASGNMLNPGMNNMMNMNNGMGGGGGNNGMGGNGNNYGNGNTSGSMQSNHNPDAAKDYMQRLRSLRQGGTSGGGNNMGGMMPDPLISSSQGYGAYGNVGNNNNNNMGGNNNGLGLSGGNMSNNMMMNNMMNNMQQMQGNKPSGGRGVPEDFTIEEYQASLQQFLSHTDDFGGGGASNEPTLSAADRMALEREMAAKGLANNSASSSSRQYNTNAGGRHVHVATNLEDGNSRNGNNNNNNNADMEGSGSADMDINRDTFKSVDSADRPSFQSFKTVDTMDIRNTFKSVDTMDLMSIGNSINEIMDDELKQHPEMRKKYGRRLSNASSSNRYSRGRHDNKIPPGNNNVHGAGRSAGDGAAAAAATLSDFANHPSRTLEIKTLDHGNGRASGGPKKIRKAMDPRAIDPRLVAAAAKAGRHSVQTKDNDGRSGGGRGSMLSIKDLNFDGVDDTSRMSFGNISVMSELTDFQEMMAKGQDSYNQL